MDEHIAQATKLMYDILVGTGVGCMVMASKWSLAQYTGAFRVLQVVIRDTSNSLTMIY